MACVGVKANRPWTERPTLWRTPSLRLGIRQASSKDQPAMRIGRLVIERTPLRASYIRRLCGRDLCVFDECT